jgi:hypothetical protein
LAACCFHTIPSVICWKWKEDIVPVPKEQTDQFFGEINSFIQAHWQFDGSEQKFEETQKDSLDLGLGVCLTFFEKARTCEYQYTCNKLAGCREVINTLKYYLL